ncbi:cobalt-zinc-cadmium outer membrane resistance protein [Janthinobacterium sp. Marseille]|nr:TolC family protein [Janthinobacterium sp. Marseille]ABR90234.1 cobalt-zinc-cadmium outer membrane resistance protein [Janthinobacterium sp. Marseille]
MYRYLLPLGIAALALAPAFAQTYGPVESGLTANRIVEPADGLTLEAALKLALDGNADLSAARNEAAAVDATIRQAGLIPNPEVSVQLEGAQRDTRTTTWLVNQPIELGGKRTARINAASRAYDTAYADLNSKRAEIRALVITAFFNVLNAQERLRLAEASLQLAQRGSLVASRRVAAGKVSPVEETKARVAEANVRLELSQAKSELVIARKRLAATWGNAVPRFQLAQGNVESLPVLPQWPELNARLNQSPLLIRTRHELERLQAVAEVEKSRRIPDVTVSMGVKKNGDAGNQAVVGLSIPFPMFDRNQGNILEALRRVDKARDELNATEIRLDGELAQAYERLNTTRIEADTLQRDILPGAQSAYDAATTGFEFGKFNFLDVLDAQRTLLQARSQYLRTLAEAHSAAAEIDRILGAPDYANKP